jgi:hypothetical protein
MYQGNNNLYPNNIISPYPSYSHTQSLPQNPSQNKNFASTYDHIVNPHYSTFQRCVLSVRNKQLCIYCYSLLVFLVTQIIPILIR